MEQKIAMETLLGTLAQNNAKVYLRVLELQAKYLEQGVPLPTSGPMQESLEMATEGLKEELTFLSFLRGERTKLVE
jgi:hypothetical protein